METDLKVAVDKDSADYRRLGANSLWPHIQEHVERCFGPLASVVKEQLKYNPYLRQCYVRDFGKHEDERPVLERLKKLILPKDWGFYDEIEKWIGKKPRYFEALLGAGGYPDNFRPTEWEELHYPRMLCGKKGSGKTTLLLFAKDDIEEHTSTNCVYVCLADSPASLGEAWSAITRKIIQYLDQLTLQVCARDAISPKDMVVQRHERQWRLIDAYPDPRDSPKDANDKRRARDGLMKELTKSKYGVEFIPYVRDTVEFLEKACHVKLVFMIDDIDRLQSEEVARDVCDRARGLARDLGTIPVIVSIREETMAKLSDVSSFATRISIIPPSFSRVLQSRLEVFLNDFKFGDDARAQKAGYDTDKAKTFVKHIIESILQRETYTNLIAYHYDLDILLDLVRCLLKSPFLETEYVLDLHGKGQRVPWHVVLDTMQRFQYQHFYEENSFLLNVFDNDESPATMSNTLIRIRLLQVLRYRFKGIRKPIQLGEIYADLEMLGYDKQAVLSALGALARQRLIVTSRIRNAFSEEVRNVLPEPTIVYYLDSLIYNYRYLQNVLPVTHVPFDVPMDLVDIVKPIAGEKLKLVDRMLIRFVGFVRECEGYERKRLKDAALFKEIAREETLSAIMEAHLAQEIQHMKEPSE